MEMAAPQPTLPLPGGMFKSITHDPSRPDDPECIVRLLEPRGKPESFDRNAWGTRRDRMAWSTRGPFVRFVDARHPFGDGSERGR
jgi:hypothetical protein